MPEESKPNPYKDVLKGLRWYEGLLIILPIGLFAVGGAIGGGLGAVAYVVNLRVFATDLPKYMKYACTVGTLVGAVILYFVAVIILQLLIAWFR